MRKARLLILIIAFASCQQQEVKTEPAKSYFDLAGFFHKEAARLQKNNQPITKLVDVNGKTEEKQITIKSWKQELNAFISADINKAAWRGAFKIEQAFNKLTYTANNDKIAVKKVEIEKNGSVVKRISIFTHTKNNLYTTTDTLLYAVDSIYQIKSSQKIQLLQEKIYRVTGKFKP